MTILLWLLAAIVVIASLVAMFWPKQVTNSDGSTVYEPTIRWGRSPVVLLAVMLATFLGGSPVQIGPAERGVVVRLGHVTGTVFNEGFHWKVPIFDSVQVMDIQVHAHKVAASGASKDLQDVSTEVTLNYFLRSDAVSTIYQTLRRDYIIRVIDPAIQEAVKSITAQFNAEQLIVERAVVRDAIDAQLDRRLEEHGIVVEQINITDFDFSESFNEAIESKVTAQQEALRATNQLRRIEVEADQLRAKAAGERDANIARANGEAQATLLRAEAQAKANRLLAESIDDRLIRYQMVQSLAPDAKLIVLPTGTNFILGPELLGGSK